MSSQIASAPTYEVPDGLQGNEIFSAMIASVIALAPKGSVNAVGRVMMIRTRLLWFI